MTEWVVIRRKNIYVVLFSIYSCRILVTTGQSDLSVWQEMCLVDTTVPYCYTYSCTVVQL